MDNIPYGYCHCGCGEKTPLYKGTNRQRGIIKGEPCKYILGHHTAKSAAHYQVADAGYKTPCWMWLRAKDPWGYGNHYEGGKYYRAHRFYYEKHVGLIPRNLVLHHDCDNTSCVNPGHLRPITQSENLRIARQKRK